MMKTSVEELLRAVSLLPEVGEPTSIELGVSDTLSFQGKPVPQDIAMAIVLDALLARGYVPNGVAEEPGGHRYRYVRDLA
jgi:hypothetical protein